MDSIIAGPQNSAANRLFIGKIERGGVIMSPDPQNDDEVMGVCNPAVVRSKDGSIWLFARVVAAENYSRIGMAKVNVDSDGVPETVVRQGYALVPETDDERNGVEDPRVVYLPQSDNYLMTYSAYNREIGPRVAMAVSDDLVTWSRIGLVHFADEPGLNLDEVNNKDAVVFPEPVRMPDGKLGYAMLHRPEWPPGSKSPDGGKPSIWVSYCPIEDAFSATKPAAWRSHRIFAAPERNWEHLKIGSGAPPLLTPEGWLLFYHGVSGSIDPQVELQTNVFYRVGAMLLDRDDPTKIIWRTPQPVMTPTTADEQFGVVNNVIFPTGALMTEEYVDLFYGMSDMRVGTARVWLER